MSGLETAAAVVGITDVAIRSIVSFYSFIKDLQEAPPRVLELRAQTEALYACLSGFGFLKDVNQSVREEVKKVGLAETVNQCGRTCGMLEEDLKKWTKAGIEALSSKLRVVQHKAKIARYTASISAAKSTVTLAVVIANFAIVAQGQSSADQQRTPIENVSNILGQLADEARRGVQEADVEMANNQKMLDVDDDDAGLALAASEIAQQKKAYEELWARCGIAKRQVQRLAKTRQVIGVVKVGDLSRVEVGMPKTVVEMVESQSIGDVTVGDNSDTKVGIF